MNEHFLKENILLLRFYYWQLLFPVDNIYGCSRGDDGYYAFQQPVAFQKQPFEDAP